MELQDGTGAKAGSRGTMTGLTDLFTHLSHIEHSKNIVDKIQGKDGRAFLIDLLDTYPHLPQQIKDDIIAYKDNQDKGGAAAQAAVDVIFTTGHFFQRLNCNIESHRNRGVFTQQVIKQSQSELEQTEITAVAPMDNTDPTVLLTQRTEIDNPDVG